MAEHDPKVRSVSVSDDRELTGVETDSPEERLLWRRADQSDKDAMGLDKRRKVIGGRYSASVARQATLYGVFLAVLAAVVIGFIVLAGELDQAPAEYQDQAPWAQPDAPQEPPAPLQ